MSNTAISELKRRYKEIYIAWDGDKAGIEDSKKLQEETGFKIIDCPLIDKAKDWSDIYHYYGKEVLSREFNKAIKEAHWASFNFFNFSLFFKYHCLLYSFLLALDLV